MAEWVSIKERLPEQDEIVLLSDGKTYFFGWLHGFSNKLCYVNEYLAERNRSIEESGITHWMPMPELPK